MSAGGKPKGAPSNKPKAPSLKIFRGINFYEKSTDPQSYIEHILTELGRLGLAISDIESRATPRQTNSVLSDLLNWFADHPGDAYAHLTNWLNIDREVMSYRLKNSTRPKPRIELSAELTRFGNLSVRWYPRGWCDDVLWDRSDDRSPTDDEWRTRYSDFGFFDPEYKTSMVSRPLNELMFIHGVKHLDPAPGGHCRPYEIINRDVLDTLLVGAVCAAFNLLVEQLRYSFEVTLRNDFKFDTVEECVSSPSPFVQNHLRVVKWRMIDLEVPPMGLAAPVIRFPGLKS